MKQLRIELPKNLDERFEKYITSSKNNGLSKREAILTVLELGLKLAERDYRSVLNDAVGDQLNILGQGIDTILISQRQMTESINALQRAYSGQLPDIEYLKPKNRKE